MPGRPGAPAGKGTNQDQRMSGTCLVSFNDSSTHACHAGPSAYAAAVLSRVNIICPGCFSVFYHDKQKGIVCVCVCECVCVYAGCVCVVVCVCWVYPCKYYSAASAGLFIRYEKRTPPPTHKLIPLHSHQPASQGDTFLKCLSVSAGSSGPRACTL